MTKRPATAEVEPATFGDTSPGIRSGASVAHVVPALLEGGGVLPTDRDFVAMRAAYQATGGIASGDDLVRSLEEHQQGDFMSLARLVIAGEIFSFEWRESFWVPMFQFNLKDLTVNPGHRRVLAELATDFDGWSLANWFAQPNSWLNGHRPVDQLDSHLWAVVAAARADRFIAGG